MIRRINNSFTQRSWYFQACLKGTFPRGQKRIQEKGNSRKTLYFSADQQDWLPTSTSQRFRAQFSIFWNGLQRFHRASQSAINPGFSVCGWTLFHGTSAKWWRFNFLRINQRWWWLTWRQWFSNFDLHPNCLECLRYRFPSLTIELPQCLRWGLRIFISQWVPRQVHG